MIVALSASSTEIRIFVKKTVGLRHTDILSVFVRIRITLHSLRSCLVM